ncbi:MAG: hypothetical protein Kow0058_18170 [Roseovarius sp.]
MIDPRVMTVILNYRTPELTLKALAGAVREMAGIRGEIVVVDNHSDDDSCALIEAAIMRHGWGRDGRVRLLRSPRNGGYGAGNNLAMRAGFADGSQPDFYYILNSDAVPQPGAIHALLSFMLEHRGAGIAGSFIRGSDGRAHQTAFRFPTVAGEFEGAARTGLITRALAGSVIPLPLPRENCRVDWVAGASAMLRRQMLDRIGLFDEGFFLYFEETDLCLRAARAGWETWYVVASVVEHEGSASTGMKRWRRTPPYWFDSRLRYFVKNHGRAYAAAATLARASGAVLWRLRVALSARPLDDPPHFLRDLLVHFARNFARGDAHRIAAPVCDPAMEDAK